MSLFHIHVDASWLSEDFESFLTDQQGFCRTDFVSPDGGRAQPSNHLTLKVRESQKFRCAFEAVTRYAQAHRAMSGYVEGEFVRIDKRISTRPFDPTVGIPFRLQLGRLPPGSFRQSEIHLTLCPERSDKRLLQKLRDMGLLMIYMPKPSGIALICTAQGTTNVVSYIAAELSKFLDKAGGAVSCTLKEERIAKWWVSDNLVALPLVVDKVCLESELAANLSKENCNEPPTATV